LNTKGYKLENIQRDLVGNKLPVPSKR